MRGRSHKRILNPLHGMDICGVGAWVGHRLSHGEGAALGLAAQWLGITGVVIGLVQLLLVVGLLRSGAATSTRPPTPAGEGENNHER